MKSIMQLNKHVSRSWSWWEVNLSQTLHCSYDCFLLLSIKTNINQPMRSQTTQVNYNYEGTKAENDKQFTSKDIQTDLHGSEVEKLRGFHDKHLERQLKLDVELRWDKGSFLFAKTKFGSYSTARNIEELFTLELNKSDEKIVKLTSEISSLQVKLVISFMAAVYDGISPVDKIEWGNQQQWNGNGATCRFENRRN